MRVLTRAIPSAFADVACSAPLRRLVIVSPWVTGDAAGDAVLDRALRWARRCGAAVHLVTRPPASDAHKRAAEAVLASGGRVTTNPSLHAKIFIAEFVSGARAAVVGSANFTASSDDLLETAVLVISLAHRPGPDAVDDILAGPLARVLGDQDSRPLTAIALGMSRCQEQPVEGCDQ